MGGWERGVQEASGLQFFLARQVVEARQAEMFEEEVGGAPGHRLAAAHAGGPSA